VFRKIVYFRDGMKNFLSIFFGRGKSPEELAADRDQKGRSKPLRKDVQTVTIQEGLEFDIYWKDTGKVGIGPTVAVYAKQREVLRFDCFGPDLGHFHIFNRSDRPKDPADRLFFHEESRAAQIDRTLWELENNLASYLQLHSDPAIRNMVLEKDMVTSKIQTVDSILRSNLRKVNKYLAENMFEKGS